MTMNITGSNYFVLYSQKYVLCVIDKSFYSFDYFQNLENALNKAIIGKIMEISTFSVIWKKNISSVTTDLTVYAFTLKDDTFQPFEIKTVFIAFS